MSNIKRLKDKDGNYIYPVTHASAVFDDEGKNLVENVVKVNDDLTRLNTTENLLLNNTFKVHDNNVYHVQLGEGEELAEVVNNAFDINEVKMVAVPPGNYTISQPIEIPAGKTLLLSGGSTEYNESVSPNSALDTVLYPENIESMIIMHSGSVLKGGALYTKNYQQDIVCVLLNFYNEEHCYTTVSMTKMIGNRNYKQTAVLMECDDPNGELKDGYGVYCNFNATIYAFDIAYHLHRHNNTDSDGVGETVWCTQNTIEGNITHCNRYIWYDTIGGWAGNSSIISATLQAGPIVGTDTPAIEVDCDNVHYIGQAWDFGGKDLQQNFAKLNSKARMCKFDHEIRDAKVVDNGTDNIFYNDLSNTVNSIASATFVNSIEGNEDDILLDFTTRIDDVESEVIKYEDSNYTSGLGGTMTCTFSNGATIQGVELALHKYIKPSNKYLYNHQNSVRFKNCNAGIITLTFPGYIGLYRIAYTVYDTTYPKNVNIYGITTTGNKILLHRKYFGDTMTYTNRYAQETIIADVQSVLIENRLYVKQRILKQLVFEIEGAYDNNNGGQFGIGNIQLETSDLYFYPKTRQLHYNYDVDNFRVIPKLGNTNIYGDPLVDIDFSNTDTVDEIRQYFNESIALEVRDGRLCVYAANEETPINKINIQRNTIFGIELDISQGVPNNIYTINGIHATIASQLHACGYSTLRLFNPYDNVLLYMSGQTSTISSDNPIKIKRLVIYNALLLDHMVEIYNVLNTAKR